MEGISFGDMVGAISRDLKKSQANREANKQSPLFKVDSLELEVNFAVAKDTTVDGGIKFWVIQAGAGVASKQSTTHKAKLHLKLNRGGEDDPWGSLPGRL